MKNSWHKEYILELLLKQLNNFFIDIDAEILALFLEPAYKRAIYSFKHFKNKYYEQMGFSPYHSCQYAVFLYYLSNLIWKAGNSELAGKIFYLNKIMNGIDWYYEIELPDIFFCEHPLGSVLGRASYSNYLFIYQGCTIGGSGGYYPVLGEKVLLYSNVSILGNTVVGNNVILGSGTTVIDEIIPDNCMVFGKSPNLIIKQKDEIIMKEKAKHIYRLDNCEG